jgi:hypothetical protein
VKIFENVTIFENGIFNPKYEYPQRIPVCGGRLQASARADIREDIFGYFVHLLHQSIRISIRKSAGALSDICRIFAGYSGQKHRIFSTMTNP